MTRICVDTNGETAFVRILNVVFSRVGAQIARHPWKFIVVSTAITLAASCIIPFTEMVNDVSDFTPATARARKELDNYKHFFSNKGEPIALYVLVTAKNQSNMLGIRQLEEAVRLLNTISERFKVWNEDTEQEQNFLEFCDNFCTINEPVRHFYNGLLVENNFGNSSDHIDLGYPITTVLGRQLHMDPNFFGVKVAVHVNLKNDTRIVSVNQLRTPTGQSIFDSKETSQIRNNIREIKLIGLQFRAERPASISMASIKKWEKSILTYLQEEFKSDYVDAYVLSESFLTAEVVRAGLTLLPFLVIGFSIMVVFSSITMSLAALYVGQMAPHKVLLAIVACVCPFMACGTALGLMFWCGFRFGSILCVTPFLVLALGVDDAYIMINSWQRIRKIRQEIGFHEGSIDSKNKGSVICCNSPSKTSGSTTKRRVESLMAEVMIDTGASITITTATNVLAFAIGALTPTPEIQLFSIGNALAITIDYVYEWTVFGSLMSIVGHWELDDNCGSENNSEKEIVRPPSVRAPSAFASWAKRCQDRFLSTCSKFVAWYCRLLTNTFISSLVVAVLAGYLYISIYGVLNTKAELRPQQLFLQNSDVIKVSAYENLPSSVGNFSTKFWLRDYEQFVRENGEDLPKRLVTIWLSLKALKRDIRMRSDSFLTGWPEFSYWKGFMRLDENGTDKSRDIKVNRFFFTTASYGAELKEWSKREDLLNQWRRVADSYPELDVSVFEDDAKFLDLIPTMIPQTAQSSFWTLLCMFCVCLLFMTHPTTVLISNFSIFSTCVGLIHGLLVIPVLFYLISLVPSFSCSSSRRHVVVAPETKISSENSPNGVLTIRLSPSTDRF
uniref:SSD domain-containing protein n=1 Tax=Ditylenchus dipsaci TaxID=166011 RepID=A0A915EVZ0_9BILA